MFIHEAIFNETVEKAKELNISDIRIGLGYICVELEEEFLGISYSFTKELDLVSCNVLDLGEKIIGKRAVDFVIGVQFKTEWASNWNGFYKVNQF